MAAEATEALATFAATLRYEDIPEAAREHCRKLLLDALACGLAGHLGDETGQVAALAGALAQSRESSVIGGERLSLAGATLLNAYLVTAVTMCDVHRPTMTHVTPEVVPAALAIAERDGSSGRDLLVALAAGLEVTVRIGIGLDYHAFRARGWHGPGVIGPFGAAASVARLRGLDGAATARAFGLAGSQSAGTFAAWGTPTVKFHQCRGALSGLLAALLAEQDFAATRAFLTAKDGGLYASYSNGGRPELATEALGQAWRLQEIALRLWPSASLLQGLATALFALLESHRVATERVRAIRIGLSPAAFDMHGKLPQYKGKFDALISGHYAAAAILHDRQLTLAQFEPARYEDPKLRRAAVELVQIAPQPNLSGVETTVEVELQDGSMLRERCDHPRGSPELPVSWDDIERKFRTYAPSRLPPGRIDAIVDRIVRLEELASARELMELLRSAGPAVSAA